MKKTIVSLLALVSFNASAMEIFCETGMSPVVIKKFNLSRADRVIEKISEETTIKARINEYNLASLTVESSDKYYFEKNIAQAETIVAENSAVFIALNYLRSADDDQHQLGGAVCGSSKAKVTELREYINKQSTKLGSEVK